MNGQRVDVFKNRDKVDQLKSVNPEHDIGGLRVKLDSLLGDRRDRLNPFLIKIFCHDNDNVVAPAELDHAVEGRRDHLMLVEPRAPKQEIKRGL